MDEMINYKNIFIFTILLVLISSPALAVNFTDWESYGTGWKAHNDTHYLIKWNNTSTTHEWISTGNTSNISEYLIVGGGGSGAGYYYGGGGGGGGFRTGTFYVVNGTYTITVGAGGVGPGHASSNLNGNRGGNSSFGDLLSTGGGGGRTGNGAAGSTGVGAAGGASISTSTGTGEGGGGANGAGTGETTACGSTVPNGGVGLSSNMTGTVLWYSGGGGGYQGCNNAAGSGGSGVGGAGAKRYSGVCVNQAGAGMNERGGGAGGAASDLQTCYDTPNGGSGIVMISYPIPNPIPNFTAYPTLGYAPFEVTFTDLSTLNPTYWLWDFGDGNTTDNTSQNPRHLYTATGSFTVNLSVGNASGNFTISRPRYISSNSITQDWLYYGDGWIRNNTTHTWIKWNTSGNHYWLSTGNTTQLTEYLIVGGGGSGGGANYGAGGGGGGIRKGTSYAVSGNIFVQVGAGGSYNASGSGLRGGNSSFNFINATGGGGGNLGNSSAGHDGYGGEGGFSFTGNNTNCPGGGGGAGEAGDLNTTSCVDGKDGGDGDTSSITGVLTYYGGGGGGSLAGAQNISNYSRGGLGGGGDGGMKVDVGTTCKFEPTSGANESGGGGGGRPQTGCAATSFGGSGIVIILYETPIAPTANFTYNNTLGIAPITIKFNDTSTGVPTSWNWSFGDGNYSTEQHPIHVYSTIGTYSVSLTATNDQGFDILNMPNLIITTSLPTEADNGLFSWNITDGTTVNFTDLSPDINISTWDFGDGNTSSNINVTHEYPTNGTYLVTHTTFDGVSNSTTKTLIYIPPETPTDEWLNTTTFVCYPLDGIVNTTPITCTDLDTNRVNDTWNVSDGSTYNGSNFVKIFSAPGTYTVNLSNNELGGTQDSDTNFMYRNYIEIYEASYLPIAIFTSNITTGYSPLAVQFTDQSTYEPTSYVWNFTNVTGNNTPVTFSTDKDPVYIFGTGNWSIKLNVTNPVGENISNATYFINVSTELFPPISAFTKNVSSGSGATTVQFTDMSTNIPTSWIWNFTNVTGNNTPVTFSTTQNPISTFNAGNWLITLTATNNDGSDTSDGQFVNISAPSPSGGKTITGKLNDIQAFISVGLNVMIITVVVALVAGLFITKKK